MVSFGGTTATIIIIIIIYRTFVSLVFVYLVLKPFISSVPGTSRCSLTFFRAPGLALLLPVEVGVEAAGAPVLRRAHTYIYIYIYI